MPREEITAVVNKAIWIVPQGDQWAVKREGSDRAFSLHDTQAGAIARGRGRAIQDRTELIIQGMDGHIRSKDSYGNDPPSRKDREH